MQQSRQTNDEIYILVIRMSYRGMCLAPISLFLFTPENFVFRWYGPTMHILYNAVLNITDNNASLSQIWYILSL